MESQVTILATLPRSDTIQTKSLYVSCWPERAFTSPTASRTRHFQGRHLGAHEIPSEEQRPSGQLQHEDRTSCKPHSGALGTGNLHRKRRLSCRVSVISRDFWSPAFGSLSACVPYTGSAFSALQTSGEEVDQLQSGTASSQLGHFCSSSGQSCQMCSKFEEVALQIRPTDVRHQETSEASPR